MTSGSKWGLMMLLAALGTQLVLRGVEAQDTSPAGSTLPNIAWDCSGWHMVVKGDSCSTIEKKYNITSAEFLGWNPSVSKGCTANFKEKYSYCVRVGAPGPTVKGIAANCDKWHTVKDGDGCQSLERNYHITAEQFFKWNPAVSKDCKTNFWLKYSYCVGLDHSAEALRELKGHAPGD